MPTLIAGRRIAGNGQPVDGTGFEYDSTDRLAELQAQRVSPIYSQPITGEWVFGLTTSQETHGEFERGVGIFPAGNKGPAEHFHPTYDEHFELVQDDFIFRIGGQERQASAGEKLIAPKGVPHTFRAASPSSGLTPSHWRKIGALRAMN